MSPDDTVQTLPTAGPEPAPAALPERYQDLGRVGQGGMGEVRRVRDRRLDRPLAMKILRWSLFEDPRARARFLAEAKLSARLQHPGIVPVHDQGVLADGRPWFTMRLVEGRTLWDVATTVHAGSNPMGWRPTDEGWSLRRLVAAFETVCRVVAYIHAEGVAHCDLKPGNVMVGRFGEVLLMDWGIARVLSASGGAGPALGTPRYMAPEQGRGVVTAASDVYALGAILHALLRGAPPGGQPAPLPQPPPELAHVIAQACDPDADGRPRAAEVADAVREWLEGARRRERARAELDAARELADRARQLRAQAAALRGEAIALLDAVPPHAPMEQKRAAWSVEERADELDADADQAQAAWTRRLYAALEHAPSLPEAHARLADHYRDRLEQAEAVADRRAALQAQAMLRTHDRGRHAAWLEGVGALTLVTDPPAGATLFRCVFRHRRRSLERVRALGTTPLVRVSIAPGSYLVRLERSGGPAVDYPIHIGRCEHWDGAPPGATEPAVVSLPSALEADECLVPAGWFISGGDDEALDGLSRRRLWVDGLVVARHPVTHADYLAFLDALGERAEALVPSEDEPSTSGRRPLYQRGADGRFRLGATHDGVPLRARDPVIYVDRAAASAYAAWRAAATGLPWRLPHDQEWEKAARGVDGRFFPWGNGFDPSFCCMATSHAGVPRWASVDQWLLDRSVYGVRGLAGNVRDWCANPYTRDGPPDGSRILPSIAADHEPSLIRGGSWSSAASKCRAAGRFAGAEHRLKSLGFRLVRSS